MIYRIINLAGQELARFTNGREAGLAHRRLGDIARVAGGQSTNRLQATLPGFAREVWADAEVAEDRWAHWNR